VSQNECADYGTIDQESFTMKVGQFNPYH